MSLAVCYARVSTISQSENGVSLDAQIERLLSYCNSMGLVPVHVIREEAISGAKPLQDRPGGRQLLQVIASGTVTNVVSYRLDRLFRSTQDALANTEAWDKAGVTVHFCDMGGTSLSTASAMGRILLSLLASFAEFERNLISERTASALAHKKRRKQAYNQTPYGYRKEGKSLVPEAKEQKVVQQMFQWRKEGQTLYEVASRLNALGVPSKKGGQWHSETVRAILRNDLHVPSQPENLIPMYQPKQPAEVRFMGHLAEAIKDFSTPSKNR